MQLEWIVDKLLAKEADYRYQSAAGLLADLKTLDLSGSGQTRRSMTAVSAASVGVTPAAVSKPSVSWWLLGAIGVAALAVGFGAGGLMGGEEAAQEPLLRVNIPIPNMLGIGFPAMSPKKDYMAFVGGDVNGQNGIFLRDMATGEIRNIEGSGDAGAREIAFSPDGSRLAYTRSVNSGLVTVTIPSGLPEVQVDSMRFVFWKSNCASFFGSQTTMCSWSMTNEVPAKPTCLI